MNQHTLGEILTPAAGREAERDQAMDSERREPDEQPEDEQEPQSTAEEIALAGLEELFAKLFYRGQWVMRGGGCDSMNAGRVYFEAETIPDEIRRRCQHYPAAVEEVLAALRNALQLELNARRKELAEQEWEQADAEWGRVTVVSAAEREPPY